MSKISIQTDMCLNLMLPLCATHDFIPLPPFPPVPPPLPAAPLSPAALAMEIPVPAWWPPGYVMGANKFTTTVFHKSLAICLDSHDCGKFILHLQITPAMNNTLSLVQTALSSRKANFSASKVKANKKPIACMTLIGWPPTPMTYCANPISMPLADAPTSHLNTVTVGMTLADWFAGVFAIVAGMILDKVLFSRSGGTKGFGKGAGKMIGQSAAGKSVASMLTSKFVGTLFPKWGDWAIKQGVGVLVGLVRTVTTGEGTVGVSLPIGGPFLGGTASVSAGVTDGTTDTWSAGITGNATVTSATAETGSSGTSASVTRRSPLGLGQEGASYTEGKGASTTETNVYDPFDGFHNSTVTDSPTGTKVVDSHSPIAPPNQL
jgi:hypothetical protein